MVFVGEKKQQNQTGSEPCFGQLPHTENANCKRLQNVKTHLEEFFDCAQKRRRFKDNTNNGDLQHKAHAIESEVS
jgi:hypothetical protein